MNPPLNQLMTLEDIRKAVEEGKAVEVPESRCFRGPIPAAFIINLQGSLIWRLLQTGMFIYEKKDKQ